MGQNGLSQGVVTERSTASRTCLSAQAQPARANAALDVSEIFLEHFDSQAKFSAEVVELPL